MVGRQKWNKRLVPIDTEFAHYTKCGHKSPLPFSLSEGEDPLGFGGLFGGGVGALRDGNGGNELSKSPVFFHPVRRGSAPRPVVDLPLPPPRQHSGRHVI